MALNDCIASIRKNAPSLTEDEALELLAEVNDAIAATRATTTVADMDAKLNSVVDEIAGRAEREAVNKKRMRALNFLVRTRHRQRLSALPLADLPDALDGILAGKFGNSQFKESIEASSRALERKAFGLFLRGVEDRGVERGVAIAFLRNEKNNALLFKETDNPGSTNNPTARAVAEAMESTNEFLRKTANRYGADIGRIPGYLAKQAHDADKMIKAGKNAWVAKIGPLLDEERTFGRPMTEAERAAFLGKVYDTIVVGKRSDLVSDSIGLDAPPGLTGPGNLGKKLSSQRSLHFKQDGESAWVYMQDFGIRDIGAGFDAGVGSMAKSIAAMQHLGPNPKAMFNELVTFANDLAIEGGDTKVIGQLQTDSARIGQFEALYDEVAGNAGRLPPIDNWRGKLARSLNFTKNLSSSAILGAVTLTSFGDLGTAAVRLADVGVGFMDAHASTLSGLIKGRRSGEIREVADSIGVGMESLMASIQSRWLGNDIGDGHGSHLISTVMRVTGMNWLNDTMKTSVGLTMGNYIAKQAGKSFDGINKNLRFEMEAYGITADDFDAITASVRDVDGKVYIDLDNIVDRGAAQRFQEFVVGFTDSAILTPGARTNAFVRNTIGSGQRGDIMTEVGNLFFHVKSFSIAYGTEILGRAYSKGEGARIGYAIHLLVSSLVYGYLASSLKDIAKGRAPRDPREPATWGKALLTSGGAGFYGDILIGYLTEEKRLGSGPFEQAAGPVLGVLGRGIKLAEYAVKGEGDKAAQEAFRLGKSVLPFGNVWYARAALDYLIFWEMAEYLRPGFAAKFERRVREDTGQDMFLKPTDAVR